MQIKGKIFYIGQTETVGSNGFEKRLIVIETEEQYPQKIGIEFVQAKVNLLDQFRIGETVSVDTNIRGSEYNGKYYVSLQGWKIER